MDTLAISHNLFLTREQRYNWYNGEDLEIIGVSVPVWADKKCTSEPAIEVFCKYKLLTSTDKIRIKHTKTGYEIKVPKKPVDEPMKLPDDIWASLSKEEKDEWYRSCEPMPSIHNLLDLKDGGSSWLAFRQFGTAKKKKMPLNVLHFVEIKRMEDLLQTLV